MTPISRIAALLAFFITVQTKINNKTQYCVPSIAEIDYEKVFSYVSAAESQNCKRGQPRFCRETALGRYKLESMN